MLPAHRPADEPEADTSNAASTTSTGSSPDDPDAVGDLRRYEVDPPGEFDGVQSGDDMLLVGTDTIPDDVVDAIRDIRINGRQGGGSGRRFSLGSFSLENRNYRIAAVDAGGLPAVHPGLSSGAVFQDAWDRVAGGEVAVLEELKGRIPLDKDGYLAVGSGEQTFPIHVGAWTSQVGTIDAVVNTEWGEALGLPKDNALVINTGAFSPQAVEGEAGEAARREHVDHRPRHRRRVRHRPRHLQSAQVVGTFAEAVGVFRYTPIGGGRVQPEAGLGARPHRHRAVPHPRLGHLQQVHDAAAARRAARDQTAWGSGAEIQPDEYAGCYYPRFIAGSTTLSNHSFGLASTSTRPATSAAPSARSAARSSRSSRSGASPGVATGTTPTPCTSSSSGSSGPADAVRHATVTA